MKIRFRAEFYPLGTPCDKCDNQIYADCLGYRRVSEGVPQGPIMCGRCVTQMYNEVTGSHEYDVIFEPRSDTGVSLQMRNGSRIHTYEGNGEDTCFITGRLSSAVSNVKEQPKPTTASEILAAWDERKHELPGWLKEYQKTFLQTMHRRINPPTVTGRYVNTKEEDKPMTATEIRRRSAEFFAKPLPFKHSSLNEYRRRMLGVSEFSPPTFIIQNEGIKPQLDEPVLKVDFSDTENRIADQFDNDEVVWENGVWLKK